LPVEQRVPLRSFLRVREVAVILGISDEYLYKCIRTGLVPAVKLGRIWLIPSQFINGLSDPAKLSELLNAGKKRC
jgi:excisionase family DNA binding protein